MLDKFRSNGKSLVVFVVVLSTLIFSYVILILLNYKFLKKYDEMVLPGSYVLDYGITNLSFSEVREKLNLCQDEVLSKKVKLLINDKEYEYSLKEIGVNLDVSKTVDNIVLYQKKLKRLVLLVSHRSLGTSVILSQVIHFFFLHVLPLCLKSLQLLGMEVASMPRL